MPPPLWHPLIAIMPYYLYAIVEKFPVLVMRRHRNAPPPPMGAGSAQGGRSYLEKRISTVPKNELFSQSSDGCDPDFFCLFFIHSCHDIDKEAVHECIAGNSKYAGVELPGYQPCFLLPCNKAFNNADIFDSICMEQVADLFVMHGEHHHLRIDTVELRRIPCKSIEKDLTSAPCLLYTSDAADE